MREGGDARIAGEAVAVDQPDGIATFCAQNIPEVVRGFCLERKDFCSFGGKVCFQQNAMHFSRGVVVRYRLVVGCVSQIVLQFCESGNPIAEDLGFRIGAFLIDRRIAEGFHGGLLSG